MHVSALIHVLFFFRNAKFSLIMHPLAQLSEERDEELFTVYNGIVVCVNVQELVYKQKNVF